MAAELLIRVYDRGPEPDWHRDRSLYGPWCRFEAELSDHPAVDARGMSPHEAVRRLVTCDQAELERRWAEVSADQRDRRSDAVVDFGEWKVAGAREPVGVLC